MAHKKPSKTADSHKLSFIRMSYTTRPKIKDEIRLAPLLAFDLEDNTNSEVSFQWAVSRFTTTYSLFLRTRHFWVQIAEPNFPRLLCSCGDLLRDPSVIKVGPDIGQDTAYSESNIRLRAEQTRVDGLPDGILLAPLGRATLYFHVRHILDVQWLSDALPRHSGS